MRDETDSFDESGLRLPKLAPPGSPLDRSPTWIRDLAIVGGVSALGAPLLAYAVALGSGDLAAEYPGGPVGAYPLVAGVLGALSGAALATFIRWALRGRARQLPIVVLLGGGVLAGAAWGALIDAGAGFALAPPVRALTSGFAIGGGALQLGWLWLPYLRRVAEGRRVAPVVLAACLAALAAGGLAGALGGGASALRAFEDASRAGTSPSVTRRRRPPRPPRSLSDLWREIDCRGAPPARAVLERRALLDASNLEAHVRVVPEIVDGRPAGFRVFAIRPGSLWSAIGLCNGDVVQAVAGRHLDAPDDAIDAYQVLRTATEVDLDIRRAGRPARMIVTLL